MDENKVFDMLEKIYIDLSSVKSDLSDVKSDLAGVKSDLADAKSDIKKLGAKVDGEIIPKLQATLDGYHQNYEAIQELKTLVNKNTEDISEINISLSDMKEDINFMAGKIIKHDIKINKITDQLKATRA